MNKNFVVFINIALLFIIINSILNKFSIIEGAKNFSCPKSLERKIYANENKINSIETKANSNLNVLRDNFKKLSERLSEKNNNSSRIKKLK